MRHLHLDLPSMLTRRLPLTTTGRRFFSTNPGASADLLLDQINKQAQYFMTDRSVAYDPSLPVDTFQRAVTSIHDNFGCEWPVALLSLAAIFRTVTFPLYASSMLKGKRRAEAAKDLTDLRDMAKEAVLLRDQDLVRDIDREYKHRMQGYGLSGNPLQGFGYLFAAQIPWVTTMLFALRGMSTQPDLFPSFALDSKFLWCESLALPDPYGILPLVSSTAIVLSSKRYNNRSPQDASSGRSLSVRDEVYVKYAIHGACFTFLPFAMQLPAGILIFFIFNTVFNRLATPLIHRYMWKPMVIPRTNSIKPS